MAWDAVIQPVNITIWYIHPRCCHGSLKLINGATEPWPVSGEHFSIKNLILKNGRFTKIALSH